MIEGRMNGVSEVHYGQSMYGSGFAMNPAAPYFFKEAHPLYGRQLPQKIEVTSNPPYHPYVAATDHQTPINLVAKDMPPETNGYAAFSHRNVVASPYPNNIFPFHPSSMIPGPYTPHQQVHYTPHRAPYTTTTSSISIPISRPATESSPVEVKTSQASVNGENHAFKKPDEGNRYHHKYRPKKRQVLVHTPAPIPVPTTSVPQFVNPPVTEQSPQPPVHHSRPPQLQLQPPLHPTLNDDVTLHSIDRFGANHFVQCGSEENISNLTEDEFESMLKQGEFVRMQEITMEDWQRYARKCGKDLSLITIKRIFENSSGKVQYLLISSNERNQRELGVLEAEVERPLYVCGRGWTSYSPDRTRERCKGMHCSKINEGDVVLTLTEKTRKRPVKDSTAASDQSSNKKQQRSHQKQLDLKENRTSDLHEFTNNAAAATKKPKRPQDEVLTQQIPDHMPLKKQWYQKISNDLSENHISDSYHQFNNNAAAAAVNRGALKRPSENDSNNNESASAAAKRKRSQEEANLTRRWSDSCLEKPC